ncbi:MAG: hypothetical protein ACD_80C00065G0002, partial [uncultured bacterium (gcode 4)]
SEFAVARKILIYDNCNKRERRDKPHDIGIEENTYLGYIPVKEVPIEENNVSENLLQINDIGVHNSEGIGDKFFRFQDTSISVLLFLQEKSSCILKNICYNHPVYLQSLFMYMKTKNKFIKKNLLGFTLVELIVTISILAILGTISIISIQNFYGSARDSVRISDIKSIQRWLSIFLIKSQTYPLPEDPIEIIDNNTVLFYQGYIWETISRIINTNKNPLDPKDITRYVYVVDKNQKKAQLMGYLESGDTLRTTSYHGILKSLVNQSYANANSIDYKNRFIYVEGDKIWVLTDENSAPIQESVTGTGLNLSETNSGYVAYFWWDSYGEGKSTGTGDILITQILWAINNTIPCNPVTYSGYTITALSHNEMKTFAKPLSIENGAGTGSLQVQCQNGTLDTEHAVEAINVNCSPTFVNDGSNICVPDICGNAPDFSISNGIQKYNIPWTHNAVGWWNCTFVCQAGYYWNTTTCVTASVGYFVGSSWSTTETACSNDANYQDITWQVSCKTVSWGYYSTPIGGGVKTGQTLCEANNSCINGVKTPCIAGYSSVAGSTLCTDQTSPTITSVTTSSPACNVVRFTINGASDAIWIHTTPYSFDGGTTWQTGNTKDYTGLSQTIAANQIQVKDAVGNVYAYGSSINGTAVACPVDCVGSWSNNGTCSAGCGGWVIQQTYTITTPAANGGTACSSTNGATRWGSTSCNTQACPTSGAYSYGAWTNCTPSSWTCWAGNQSRTQSCNYDSCYSPQATAQACTKACASCTTGAWYWGYCYFWSSSYPSGGTYSDSWWGQGGWWNWSGGRSGTCYDGAWSSVTSYCNATSPICVGNMGAVCTLASYSCGAGYAGYCGGSYLGVFDAATCSAYSWTPCTTGTIQCSGACQ